MPCTSGNVMFEEEPAWGERIALAENAVKLDVFKDVDGPSSTADRMMDWIPIGLMKYWTGAPGRALFGGPLALWSASM